MKLYRAIEILIERDRIGDPLKNPDYEDALRLGIEALKVILALRVRYGPAPQFNLPSEMEETK